MATAATDTWEVLTDGIRKRIVTAAPAEAPIARRGQFVDVRYTARLMTSPEDVTGPIFDDTSRHGRGERPLTFILGSSTVIDGLSSAIATMRPGETAQFCIPPTLAFGEAGLPSVDPPVPANADVCFQVSLLGAEDVPTAGPAPAAAVLSTKSGRSEEEEAAAAASSVTAGDSASAGETMESILKMMTDAETLKEHGNQRLLTSDFTGALYKYKQGLQFLEHIRKLVKVVVATQETKASLMDRAVTLKLALHANLAHVAMKLERYADALDEANEALQLDARHEKALFRRALARAKLGLRAEAMDDLRTVLEVRPDNKDASKMLTSLQIASEKPVDSSSAATDSAPAADASTPSTTAVAAEPSSARKRAREVDPLAAAARKMIGNGLYADDPNYDKPLQSRSRPSILSRASSAVTDCTWGALQRLMRCLPASCRCMRAPKAKAADAKE